MRHRAGRLLHVDFLVGQVGRLPIHLDHAAVRLARRLQIFRIRLARQPRQQLVLRLVSLVKQLDVDSVPAFDLRIDHQGRHALRRETIDGGDLVQLLATGFAAGHTGHQDRAAGGAPVGGLSVEPPFAGGRFVAADLGRGQVHGVEDHLFSFRGTGGADQQRRRRPRPISRRCKTHGRSLT